LGSAGTPLPLGGGMADHLKQAPSHMCYHVKFGSSGSNGVNRREPQKWDCAWARPLAGRVYLSPRNTPLPTCIILYRIWSFWAKRYTSIIKEIHLKNDPCQGHSRSSEPTRIDTPPMTSYQSSIAIMDPPISYRF